MKAEVIKEIFWLCLGIMKNILSLAEFKMGKKTDEYKFFKKQVMNHTYEGLAKFYQNLEKSKVLERCDCNAKLRHGFSSCPKCGGSGYKSRSSIE